MDLMSALNIKRKWSWGKSLATLIKVDNPFTFEREAIIKTVSRFRSPTGFMTTLSKKHLPKRL